MANAHLRQCVRNMKGDSGGWRSRHTNWRGRGVRGSCEQAWRMFGLASGSLLLVRRGRHFHAATEHYRRSAGGEHVAGRRSRADAHRGESQREQQIADEPTCHLHAEPRLLRSQSARRNTRQPLAPKALPFEARTLPLKSKRFPLERRTLALIAPGCTIEASACYKSKKPGVAAGLCVWVRE